MFGANWRVEGFGFMQAAYMGLRLWGIRVSAYFSTVVGYRISVERVREFGYNGLDS